jgi:hypothetical protein
MAVQAAASAGTSVAGGAGTIATAAVGLISVATRVTIAVLLVAAAATTTVMYRIGAGGTISEMSPAFDDIASSQPSLSPSLKMGSMIQLSEPPTGRWVSVPGTTPNSNPTADRAPTPIQVSGPTAYQAIDQTPSPPASGPTSGPSTGPTLSPTSGRTRSGLISLRAEGRHRSKQSPASGPTSVPTSAPSTRTSTYGRTTGLIGGQTQSARQPRPRAIKFTNE